MTSRAEPAPGFTVVVTTPDVVGVRMAGPGIRAWHFAEQLAKHVPVSLIARLEDPPGHGGFLLLEKGSPAAGRALSQAGVIVFQGGRGFRGRRRGQKLVFDLFDPVVLELRELYGLNPSPRQRLQLAAEWWRLSVALRYGDLLIRATPAQGRLYERLQPGDAPWIEVPFGVDAGPEGGHEKTLDRAIEDPPMVLWNGGVWDWLDPSTAVDAIVRVNEAGVPCRLVFLGRVRPSQSAVDPRREEQFRSLLIQGRGFASADESWVPYAERLSWLRRAKVAIMLHRPTAEAVYSIRTRLFDAIAAEVPVVATAEGYAADLVAAEGLGVVVPPSDPAAVASAVQRLLVDDEFHAGCVSNLRRIRSRFSWEAVTQPLVDAVTSWQRQHTSSTRR